MELRKLPFCPVATKYELGLKCQMVGSGVRSCKSILLIFICNVVWQNKNVKKHYRKKVTRRESPKKCLTKPTRGENLRRAIDEYSGEV